MSTQSNNDHNSDERTKILLSEMLIAVLWLAGSLSCLAVYVAGNV